MNIDGPSGGFGLVNEMNAVLEISIEVGLGAVQNCERGRNQGWFWQDEKRKRKKERHGMSRQLPTVDFLADEVVGKCRGKGSTNGEDMGDAEALEALLVPRRPHGAQVEALLYQARHVVLL